jgi:hypothetical protein
VELGKRKELNWNWTAEASDCPEEPKEKSTIATGQLLRMSNEFEPSLTVHLFAMNSVLGIVDIGDSSP